MTRRSPPIDRRDRRPRRPGPAARRALSPAVLGLLLGFGAPLAAGGPLGLGPPVASVARADPPPPRVTRAATVAQVPRGAPPAGTYRVHLIDVGTGLAILVQGADFTLLYDGGSNDERRTIGRRGNRNRLLAYLFAALGPSGPPVCVPEGDRTPPADGERVIDHLVLSHAHADHVRLLADVLRCYRVREVWDPGAIHPTTYYRDFLAAVAAEPGVVYRTSVAPTPARPPVVRGVRVRLPAGFAWRRFAEGDELALGVGARLKVLHAPVTARALVNANSVVLRVVLGDTRLLLTGDAVAGPEAAPSAPSGEIEGYLLARRPEELGAEILQVAHHGARTSSREAFLRAVRPRYALVSAGPTRYGRMVLPDRGVIDALAAIGAEILRTDVHDRDGCPARDRIGTDDALPGGCDSFVIEVGAPAPSR